MTRLRGSIIIAILISGLFLFLALRGINWQEVLDTARQARMEYLLACCVLGTGVNFLRSLRWRVLLSAEKWLPVSVVFWTTLVGYLGNTFLPARAGELLRSATLGGQCGISTSFVLATALTERIVDAVVLLAVGMAALVYLGRESNILQTAAMTMAVVGAIGIAGIAFSSRLQDPLRWIWLHAHLPAALSQRGLGMSQRFLEGMGALQNSKRALSFAGLTITIWLVDALGTTIVARALNLQLEMLQALVLLAALGLASAIPSTPGYVGTYQFVAVTILPIFGMAPSQALAFILFLQATSILVVLAWGLIGIWRLAVRKEVHGVTNS